MYLLYFVGLLVSRTHGRPSYQTYGKPHDYPTYGGHAQSYYSSDDYNDWFFEMEPHHEPSGPGFTSKIYESFHQMQEGVHMYAPALHVGKISRGHYPKPELLQPRHRNMGYNSDFHQGDASAFRYTPSFPNPRCVEVKRASPGFDCRCGVPRRKDVAPQAAVLGTIATDGTGAKMPAIESVVGGVRTERFEYPWQVGLHVKSKSDKIICGGSLLSSKTVLTAAHCIDELGETQIQDDLHVVIAQTLTQVSDQDQRIKVCKVDMLQAYFDVETYDDDFALLTLCEHAEFNNNVQPICLPSLPAQSYEGVQATVAGWGYESSGAGEKPTQILEANVTTIPTSACTPYYNRVPQSKFVDDGFDPNFKGEITSNMICAWREGKDACQGDSGGALVVQEPCGHFAQVGVVSWGLGCAEYPGVYSRVTEKLHWIQANIKGQTCPPPSQLV